MRPADERRAVGAVRGASEGRSVAAAALLNARCARHLPRLKCSRLAGLDEGRAGQTQGLRRRSREGHIRENRGWPRRPEGSLCETLRPRREVARASKRAPEARVAPATTRLAREDTRAGVGSRCLRCLSSARSAQRAESRGLSHEVAIAFGSLELASPRGPLARQRLIVRCRRPPAVTAAGPRPTECDHHNSTPWEEKIFIIPHFKNPLLHRQRTRSSSSKSTRKSRAKSRRRCSAAR